MEYLMRDGSYADRYMLDIFVEICRYDYVCDGDVGSKSKLAHEISKQISLIKMTNRNIPYKF